MTLEQATKEINELPFPAVQENDVATYDNYTFIYKNGKWEIKE